MKTFNFENFTCKLGENALDNWSLLDKSKKEYKFFHLSSFPSGYVILEYEEEPTDIMIYTSANLCEVYFKSNRKVRQNKV